MTSTPPSFDDTGRPVLATGPAFDASAGVEGILVREGISPAAALELADEIEDLFLNGNAADGFRAILRALDGTGLYSTPAGLALRRVLLGTEGRSLEADARRVSVSNQGLSYHEQRIRKALRAWL